MQQLTEPQGQGRNLSATGGLLAFLFGAWVGVAASRRYEIPRCHFPGSSRPRSEDETGSDVTKMDDRKSSWQSRLPPEVREGIEKIKAFERRYRKQDFGGDSGVKRETWSSEWTE